MPVIKSIKQHKILLDTHVLVWLMNGEPFLSSSFLKTIDRLAIANDIFIAPISIWEIAMLVEKGRLEIEMDIQEWVDQVEASPGIQLAPFTIKIAIQSCRLPGIVHGDPADRILIATAHEQSAVLVTADTKILEYGKDRFITVHDPRVA